MMDLTLYDCLWMSSLVCFAFAVLGGIVDVVERWGRGRRK